MVGMKLNFMQGYVATYDFGDSHEQLKSSKLN